MYDNWQKVREIFDAAICCTIEERQKFVVEVCGEDQSLLTEVESLLSSLDAAAAEVFLETPIVSKVAEVVRPKKIPLKSGMQLGHYEIIKQIGVGGMGEVFLAKDTNLNRKVALKLLAAHVTEDQNPISRFRQEAFATSALNHPNIVTIYEIGKWHEQDFIVTEYIEGETLRERLRGQKFSVAEATSVALQIASALAAAHGAGIIHRDIKPENLMIRADGLVKILDFGIAKYRPAEKEQKTFIETETGEIIGTASYMSPEQARGLTVDARTDIWSFGVILYEMLEGRLPFDGETKADRLAAILERQPAMLSKITGKSSSVLQKIIDRALAKDKKRRYPNIAEMAADLHDLRETTGDRFSAPLVFPVRRRSILPRHYLFAALSLLILLGAAGLWFYISAPHKAAVDGERKSIAILPIKPINQSNRDELYEIGIADSLIQRLGASKGFVVRPLSAIRKYADLEQDPLVAGREQQTDYVLASNYQTAGGKIRVTSQLLNVKTGQIEETYKSEKDVSDVFAMQDAMSEDMGKFLQTHFAIPASTPAAERRGTDNEEAYRLYLLGMSLIEKENLADSKRALEFFDKALALDPNYAKAWAEKARAHCNFAHWGGNSPDTEFANAKPALDRAFALNADSPEAHAVLGIIKIDYDWNFAEGEKQLRRAIEVSPNTDLYYRWYANRLSGQGRSDEALAMVKTAIDLNPNYIIPQVQYGAILYFARAYDDAIKQMERVIEMDSANQLAYRILWLCFHKKGDYVRAFEYFMKSQRLAGTKDDALKDYEAANAKNGWQGVLLKHLEIFKASHADASAAYRIAALSALSGEREQSFYYLDEAVKNHSLDLCNIKGDPSFDSLRGDARFQNLIQRVSVPQ